MKDYNNLKSSNYKREKIFKLKSSLCLRLDSLHSGGELILFSVDRVNVGALWEIFSWDHGRSSVAPMESQRDFGKKLVLNNLIEEFDSFLGLLG